MVVIYVSMYVCIYIYIHTCIYVYIRIYIYIYTPTYIYIYIYCLCVCIYIYIYACMHIYIYIHVCVYIYIYLHIYIYVFVVLYVFVHVLIQLRGWRNTVGNLIEICWLANKYHCPPHFTGICVNNRVVQFHQIRDFKQYFNSIPPTSHQWFSLLANPRLLDFTITIKVLSCSYRPIISITTAATITTEASYYRGPYVAL